MQTLLRWHGSIKLMENTMLQLEQLQKIFESTMTNQLELALLQYVTKGLFVFDVLDRLPGAPFHLHLRAGPMSSYYAKDDGEQLATKAIVDVETQGGQVTCMVVWGSVVVYATYGENVLGNPGGYIGSMWATTTCLFVWRVRAKIRDRFQIPGSCMGDCFTSMFCTCCALAQMATHVKSYKPGGCDFGPPDTLPAYQ
ncbi:hypothetical protein P43SY_004407 [Pythium insidiosum]|uniref:PLAC8 family protein n=1 Tax=Pythium insidiosum TaxID=114742 RepID=A0AAD5MHQ8_PYTIN|nr:hypothetical protein P43SY_004407 [Pythium insidiosum]